MHAANVYSVLRWVGAVALLGMAGLYLNHALQVVSQSAALANYDSPDFFAYEAYGSFGRSLAFVFLSGLVALNVRPGWPYLRSMWTVFLFGAVLVSLFLPATWRLLTIDNCLDRGGMWDYESEQCRYQN